MQKNDYDFLMSIYKRYQFLKEFDIDFANEFLEKAVPSALWLDFCRIKESRKKKTEQYERELKK